MTGCSRLFLRVQTSPPKFGRVLLSLLFTGAEPSVAAFLQRQLTKAQHNHQQHCFSSRSDRPGAHSCSYRGDPHMWGSPPHAQRMCPCLQVRPQSQLDLPSSCCKPCLPAKLEGNTSEWQALKFGSHFRKVEPINRSPALPTCRTLGVGSNKHHLSIEIYLKQENQVHPSVPQSSSAPLPHSADSSGLL